VSEAAIMRGEAVTLEWPERGIAVATMTRAQAMNTLSLELIDELGRIVALTRAQRARALIITGSGRAFSTGAHLKYFDDPASPIGTTPEDIRDKYLWRIATLFDSLEELPFPTIAAINGYALGGGFELALSCDFRIISTSARVGLPEVVLGATPGAGGVQKLHRFVGRGKSLEWILLGKHLTAAEIEPYGLLYAAVEPDAVVATARELARALKALSPNAIAQAKTSIYVADDADSRSARRAGIEALTSLIGGRDWREGMAAFAEKRKPRFDSF
jgi:enoyl-CoA hydratase/carnithine racemase